MPQFSFLGSLTLGRSGFVGSGLMKLNAFVRSPVTALLQALRLGTSAPNLVSRKRSREVWSKVSEHRNPPLLNGESTSSGTLKPSPIGPSMPPEAPVRSGTVRYSPGVPGGATGGARWSKNPPFSSHVRNRAVLSHAP